MPDEPRPNPQMDDLSYEEVTRIVGDLFLQVLRLRQVVTRLTTPVAVPPAQSKKRRSKEKAGLRAVEDKGDAAG